MPFMSQIATTFACSRVNEHLIELSVEDPTVFQQTAKHGKKSSIPLYTNRLGQNFPNPFNPETWIPYEIESDTLVTIQIFDTRGGSLVRQLEYGASERLESTLTA